MPKSDDQAIRSGAAHVDETVNLAVGHTQPRDLSGRALAREDNVPQPELKTALPNVTLSMFAQGSSVRVRVGNPHNSSELYEYAYDSVDAANEAMLEAGILTPDQVPDSMALAGTGIPLTGITVEQLEGAGLKRHGASTI